MYRPFIYSWTCALSDLYKGPPQTRIHATDIRRPGCRKGSCYSKTNCERVNHLFSFPIHLLPQLTFRFNKRREDFPDLRSYNDYLEEVEDISKLLWITSSFGLTW